MAQVRIALAFHLPWWWRLPIMAAKASAGLGWRPSDATIERLARRYGELIIEHSVITAE